MNYGRIQEGRLLVAGALDDQPLGRWKQAEIAGYLRELIQKIGRPNFDWGNPDLMAQDYEMLPLIDAARAEVNRRLEGKAHGRS